MFSANSKKSIKNIIGCLCLINVLLFTACKTKKLDIYEPYKDITVVYAMLSTTDNIQYIKINKAFLGDGSVYDFAQQQDSINYDPNDLTVSILGTKLNTATKSYETFETIQLKDTVLATQSTSEIFTTKNNIVWFTRKKIKSDSKDILYKLEVKTKAGKVVSGETKIIYSNNFRMQNSSLNLFDDKGKSLSYTTNINAFINANLYEYTLRMYYYEYSPLKPDVVDNKYVDLKFNEIQQDEGFIRFKYDGHQLLQFLKSKKQNVFSDITKKRRWNYLEFQLSVASPDYTIYRKVNSPRAGYILDKPIYSDIENGYGLFANKLNLNSPKNQFSPPTQKAIRDSLYELNFEQ